MPKFNRQHTAIGVCVVAGAFLAGGAVSPTRPSTATDCDGSWLQQAAQDAQAAVTGALPHAEPPPDALTGYYDVRLKKDVQIPPQEPEPEPEPTTQSFNPSTPMPPSVEPVAVPSASIPRNTAPVSAGIPAAPPPMAQADTTGTSAIDAQVDAGTYQPSVDELGNPIKRFAVPPARSGRGGENVSL